MNLRGQLVPAIDMYERLGLQIQSNKIEAISIILQCDGFLIALLVDDIGEILNFNDDAFEPPPSNFSLISRELIVGAYKLPERLILILDQKLIAVQQSSKEIVNYTSSS
jgi:purine-binding chemotaxis protein CheW